jgi:uncharacterized lipoprotein YddW (UPF0748 family)
MHIQTRWLIGYLLLAIVLATMLDTAGASDMRYRLLSPKGAEVLLSGLDQKREADTLMLYTSAYGDSTRTNAYGVEVQAVPERPGQAGSNATRYRVVQVTDVTTCQQQQTLSTCGNMAIPSKGVVLSATGSQRQYLLNTFTPGAIFQLVPVLIDQSSFRLDVMNPTPQTNPKGTSFPGTRGSNQLVAYDAGYGQAETGTNEFGYEVTVRQGRVVEHQGANSGIPMDAGDFVLSGHGKARTWLLQSVPLGSRVTVNASSVTVNVDKETYAYQLGQLVKRIEQLRPSALSVDQRERYARLQNTFTQMPDEMAARQALTLKQELTPLLWGSYPAVAASMTKAIWHRPSESTLGSIRQSLDLLKQGGFNTLYLETYLHGDPIFPSRTFEQYQIPQKRPFILSDKPDSDLLAVWIEEAHRRGLKVHVWFQTFYAGNKQYDNNVGAILTKYPHWANIQRSAVGRATLVPSTLEAGSYFLDPANQEAQQFILSLVEEIVTRYPVDGFQLDYIRYPSSFPPDRRSYVATTWGYTPTARTLFKSRTGLDPLDLKPDQQPERWAEWTDFKTRQIDRFVRKMRDTAKLHRPDLPVSVAVFPKAKESLERKHQNWPLWVASGWVDAIAPMTLTSSQAVIAEDTRSIAAMGSVPVVTGIFGPFNGNTPSDVVDQVWSAIHAGAQGVALFDTAHLTHQMAEALKAGLFKPASK